MATLEGEEEEAEGVDDVEKTKEEQGGAARVDASLAGGSTSMEVEKASASKAGAGGSSGLFSCCQRQGGGERSVSPLRNLPLLVMSRPVPIRLLVISCHILIRLLALGITENARERRITL